MAIQVVVEFTRKSPVGSSWLNSYNMQHTEYYLFSVTASTPLQHEHNYTYIRSSPKIHQKYRKYQQNQLKHRFFLLGGTIYIYICLNDFKYKYYICMDLCGRIAYKQPNTAIYAS